MQVIRVHCLSSDKPSPKSVAYKSFTTPTFGLTWSVESGASPELLTPFSFRPSGLTPGGGDIIAVVVFGGYAGCEGRAFSLSYLAQLRLELLLTCISFCPSSIASGRCGIAAASSAYTRKSLMRASSFSFLRNRAAISLSLSGLTSGGGGIDAASSP